MFITDKDKSFLAKLFEGIHIPEDFGIDYESDELLCDEDILSEINSKGIGNFKSFHGASKYVLTEEKLPYVIKIPFSGFWEPQYCEYNDEYNYEFILFDNAGRDIYCDDENDCRNYCETERRFFQVISEMDESLTSFFAEVQFIGYFCDKPVYIQEKVKASGTVPAGNYPKKTSVLADKLAKGISLSKYWIEDAINYYGEELTKLFINFLKSDDEVGKIIAEDLHNENYGYRADGSPCILDYSGFQS